MSYGRSLNAARSGPTGCGPVGIASSPYLLLLCQAMPAPGEKFGMRSCGAATAALINAQPQQKTIRLRRRMPSPLSEIRFRRGGNLRRLALGVVERVFGADLLQPRPASAAIGGR